MPPYKTTTYKIILYDFNFESINGKAQPLKIAISGFQ